MKILVACEESQAVTKEFRKLGHEAYSCDLKDCSGGHPEWHIRDNVMNVLRREIVSPFDCEYDAVIAFPDCTFLTCSAEWAYKKPPYHQNIKPGTLVGEDRVVAREEAILFFIFFTHLKNRFVAIENPVGVMSARYRKPDQIIQPYEFGDDASKKTCLWLKNLPLLKGTKYIEPRYVDGKPRWGNQTDSGQNKLGPSKNRSELRSKTYPGIARAMAEQWGKNFI